MLKKNQPISEIVLEVFQKKHDLSQDLINNLISVLIPSTTEDIQFGPKQNSLLQSSLIFSRDLQEFNSHSSDESLWKIVFGQNEVTFWKNTEYIAKFSFEIQEKSGSMKEKVDESQKEKLKSFLLSVTSLLEASPVITAEFVDRCFGRYSPFFVYFNWRLQKFLEENQKGVKTYSEQYNSWKESLKLHYDENNLTQKFYNIHLYYLLLTFELFKTYISVSFARKEQKEEENQLVFYKTFPEIKKLHFYSWWIDVLPDSHFWLENINLNPLFTNPESIQGDIFHQLYQKIVTPNIRHNLGEFYTPPNLARKIIDKEYQFGQFIMDLPAEVEYS